MNTARLGTREGARALGVFKQTVLVLRWFVDGTRLAQVARDNGISVPTAYRHPHEGLTVLAGHAPDLSATLERAAAAGHTHLNLDGTVIRADRLAAAGLGRGGGDGARVRAAESRWEAERWSWIARAGQARCRGRGRLGQPGVCQVEMWTHHGADAYRIVQFAGLGAAVRCAIEAAEARGLAASGPSACGLSAWTEPRGVKRCEGQSHRSGRMLWIVQIIAWLAGFFT